MDKRIIVIGAVSQDGVYGKGNAIPWRIKEEMEHFKNATSGHTVVMGRGTWDSLPPKFKPLPNRDNIIVTTTLETIEGARVARSVEEAIDMATKEKVFLIGGPRVWYEGMQSLAHEAFITEVRKDFWENAGDEHMAEVLLDPPSHWNMTLSSSQEYPGSIPFIVHHWTRRYSGRLQQEEKPTGHLQ